MNEAEQGLALQGVANSESGKAAEVTISRPQFRYAVRNADRCNAGVMNERSRHPALLQQLGEDLPMLPGFTEQYGCRRLKPRAYLIDGLRQR